MATTTSEEVIPREVLFGNPEYAGPSLSPDGKYLAYLRPHEGVLNAFVRTIGKNDDRVVTSDKLRGIRGVSWAQDSKTLLFNQDDGGDENFHLYGIDATTPGAAAVDLTPYPGCKAQNVVTNKRFPDELLVAVNNRNPAAFDMYRVNLPTALAGDVEGADLGPVISKDSNAPTTPTFGVPVATNPAMSARIVITPLLMPKPRAFKAGADAPSAWGG